MAQEVSKNKKPSSDYAKNGGNLKPLGIDSQARFVKLGSMQIEIIVPGNIIMSKVVEYFEESKKPARKIIEIKQVGNVKNIATPEIREAFKRFNGNGANVFNVVFERAKPRTI
jgi:hypothetical protein